MPISCHLVIVKHSGSPLVSAALYRAHRLQFMAVKLLFDLLNTIIDLNDFIKESHFYSHLYSVCYYCFIVAR